MALLATALVCMAAGSGCAQPPPASTFAISYERSGGLKPMPQKLVIRPGRRGQVFFRSTDGHDSGARIFRVSVKRIEGLRKALARADFENIGTPGPNPGVCADCYFYEIAYRGHEVSFSQVQVPKRLQGVVSGLEALFDAHLPFH